MSYLLLRTIVLCSYTNHAHVRIHLAHFPVKGLPWATWGKRVFMFFRRKDDSVYCIIFNPGSPCLY